MNRKSNTPKNQEANVGKTGRRSAGPKTGKKNELKRLTKEEQLELKIRAEEIGKGLTSSTWRELETAGKFDKNKKLDFVKDDTLIVGCDIGNCDSGRLETGMPIEKLVKALYFLNLWLDRIGRRHHGH